MTTSLYDTHLLKLLSASIAPLLVTRGRVVVVAVRHDDACWLTAMGGGGGGRECGRGRRNQTSSSCAVQRLQMADESAKGDALEVVGGGMEEVEVW